MRALLLAGVATCGLAGAANAAVITANQGGWIDASGGSNGTSINNYIVGYSGIEIRDFLGFDLDATATMATAAVLSIYVGNVETGQHSPVDVTLTATSSVTSFGSLGVGTVFATSTFTTADDDTTASISLDAAALSAIQSASGGEFYISARVTNGSTSSSAAQTSFGATGHSFGGPDPTLIITTAVPEPASLALLSLPLGLLGLVGMRRRQGAAGA